MSIVAAIHRQKEMWIGCDTATNYRDEIHPKANKCIIAPDGRSALGHAGDGLILDLVLGNKKRLSFGKPPRDMSKSIRSIIDADNSIHPYYENKEITPDYRQSWIYAWRGGICIIASDLSLLNDDEVCAIGSGAPYAMGAEFEAAGSPKDILDRMLRAAMKWNVWCGGEALMWRIKT